MAQVAILLVNTGVLWSAAHLSMKVEKEIEQLVVEGQPMRCKAVLDEKPEVSHDTNHTF